MIVSSLDISIGNVKGALILIISFSCLALDIIALEGLTLLSEEVVY